jgi:hypothetical protein
MLFIQPKYKDLVIKFHMGELLVAEITTTTTCKKICPKWFEFKFKAKAEIYTVTSDEYIGFERLIKTTFFKKKLEKIVQDMMGVITAHFLNNDQINKITITKEEKSGDVHPTILSLFHRGHLDTKIEIPMDDN